MTVSEIIKESKPLCKGFKFKYLCSILLLTIILLLELAFVTVIETTKIYDNGVVNPWKANLFFKAMKIYSIPSLNAFVTENSVDENGLDLNQMAKITLLNQPAPVQQNPSALL